MGLGRIVQMLKTTKEFDFVYKNSYKFRSESLDICVLKPNLAGQFYEKFRRLPCNFVGFSVSKKVGNAVERNLIKRRLRAICREFFGVSNSPLGMQFRACENFGESTDSSLVLSPKFSQTQKPHRKSFDCDSLCKSATNQTQNCNNSSLRDSTQRVESWQSTEYANDSCDSTNAPRGSIFGRFCGFSSARQGNRTDSSIDEAEREESRKSVKKTNARNLVCIFIAKGQILQTPFATLKNTIFATLKKQLNFRQGSYKKPRTSSPHNAQNRKYQNHTKGTL